MPRKKATPTTQPPRDAERTPKLGNDARRNPDLDPQLILPGKEMQDWGARVVPVLPLYIHETIHPQVLIHDLLQQRAARAGAAQTAAQLDLFADSNGVPEHAPTAEFYQYDANWTNRWTNRMILGDNRYVMTSLADREGLRGTVQCIYLEPPPGIAPYQNFQARTSNRAQYERGLEHMTREPEQIKAFRETWHAGVDSYLAYWRERLILARDLLSASGSIFVQISEDLVAQMGVLLNDIFGAEQRMAYITVQKTGGILADMPIHPVANFVLWYARDKGAVKTRPLFGMKQMGDSQNPADRYDRVEEATGKRRALTPAERRGRVGLPPDARVYQLTDLTAVEAVAMNEPYRFQGATYVPPKNYHWSTPMGGRQRLGRADRLVGTGKRLIFVRYLEDFPAYALQNLWTEFAEPPDVRCVVQTYPGVVARCILMTTDPGDLVLDPTCGGGTTAYVAEQWGRRWITIDTSRVALALTRARLMGARYPYYLLADSRAGRIKEAELSGTLPSDSPTYGSIRQGFVYRRVRRITLTDIANNSAIDDIWEDYQARLEPLRAHLNAALGTAWEEWQIPRDADAAWSPEVQAAHRAWWEQRMARQREIDTSIAARADTIILYDQPYVEPRRVRVAGPFTVESLSPHRILAVDEHGDLIPPEHFANAPALVGHVGYDFASLILERLQTAGVQQAHPAGRISFTTLEGWPGRYICVEGHCTIGDSTTARRAAICIGPEFGVMATADLLAAADEASAAGFDLLIVCAFIYEAHAGELARWGTMDIVQAYINQDLHLGPAVPPDLSSLFFVVGEPDITIEQRADGDLQVHLHGVDVMHLQSGGVRASEPDDIACWFIDTDYNGQRFFVRHAYFLGTGDPYGALKRTLQSEIDEEIWEQLYQTTSRPFAPPTTGRIAVKVITIVGDEVMKVYAVSGE